MTQISVHLFEFTSTSGRNLNEMIRRIRHVPKDQRWRNVGDYEVALLEIDRPTNRRLRLFDFVKRRTVGPGKLLQNGEIEGFHFGDGENFGEETAALWDQDRGWLLVQFNQHGVRSGSIASYLNIFENDPASDWLLYAKLDPRAEAELRRRPYVRTAKLKFKATDGLNAAMRDSGAALGASLGNLGPEAGSANVEIKLTMGKSRGFLNQDVSDIFQNLRQRFDKDDGLLFMEVTAREEIDGADKIIDLMRHRIKCGYSSRELEIQDGRYTLRSRWSLLERIHNGWVQEY